MRETEREKTTYCERERETKNNLLKEERKTTY